MTPCLFASLTLVLGASPAPLPEGRDALLADLQQRTMLVATWGWPPEEMAPAARAAGYEVVNGPVGNNVNKLREEAKAWTGAGLALLGRVAVPVVDPFDPEQVRKGCETMKEAVRFFDGHPRAYGVVLSWGLYGEGGFPFDYRFSDTARRAFNRHLARDPETPLPAPPKPGYPGSLRWVQWIEFRSATLRDFRETYVRAAKAATDKLVGTWSEFYPTENYMLNMGVAPGADFEFYDCSFGDYSVHPARTFAETHGDMQHFATYAAWRDHELPRAAHAVGLGVVPIGFQFPMRRGHATDFLRKTEVFIDHIEDEYALRFQTEIRKLIRAVQDRVRAPEVALVYQSFAAAALPASAQFVPGTNAPNVDGFYAHGVRLMEGLMRQMGVDVRVIPYELLATDDLTRYKIVIIQDPLYLTSAMWKNLEKAPRVLYSGEFLLTHHDPATERGDYPSGWSAKGTWNGLRLRYGRARGGALTATGEGPSWMAGVLATPVNYPEDQVVRYAERPAGAVVVARVGETPFLLATEDVRRAWLPNRFFNHAWNAGDAALEEVAYRLLRNLLEDAGVMVRVVTPPLCRVKEGFPFGPYGVTGYVAWNSLGKALTLSLADGGTFTVPAHGWTLTPDGEKGK